MGLCPRALRALGRNRASLGVGPRAAGRRAAARLRASVGRLPGRVRVGRTHRLGAARMAGALLPAVSGQSDLRAERQYNERDERDDGGEQLRPGRAAVDPARGPPRCNGGAPGRDGSKPRTADRGGTAAPKCSASAAGRAASSRRADGSHRGRNPGGRPAVPHRSQSDRTGRASHKPWAGGSRRRPAVAGKSSAACAEPSGSTTDAGAGAGAGAGAFVGAGAAARAGPWP